MVQVIEFEPLNSEVVGFKFAHDWLGSVTSLVIISSWLGIHKTIEHLLGIVTRAYTGLVTHTNVTK